MRKVCYPAIVIFVSLLFMTFNCGSDSQEKIEPYSSIPIFDRDFIITTGSDTLQPVSLQFFLDTLYVCYLQRSQIDLFTPELKKIRTIKLLNPEPVHPTSFTVTDSGIIICDHAKRIVVIYNHDGFLLNSFGLLPDQETRLSPFNLTYFRDVLYLTDIGLGKVLAISMTDVPDVTEKGELILTIPSDSLDSIEFPSAVAVTPDGRLLVGDGGSGSIQAFSCSGQSIYSFSPVVVERKMVPLGFAFDDVIDPGLKDSASFDPSGIRSMGRIHVVDANNASVHMYNSLGHYNMSYGNDQTLIKPMDIAIDIKNNRVFIADPQARSIVIYLYKG